MNYHVFIVDTQTFKYHLNYMFAGTGANDKTVPFLINRTAAVHASTERNLVGMIADVSRIREGDKIIFYLQTTQNSPGMFFGVFKATSCAFFDENDDDNYLKKELGKSLTFRVTITADCVYPVGISEHDYLDDLQDIDHPSEMCWSLIYRKLKGNRGCTMITAYEFEKLLSKLKAANKNIHLDAADSFSFNDRSFTISAQTSIHEYEGRTLPLDIKERLLFKANRYNAFEVHLQAYIMQNFDKVPLRDILLPYVDKPYWIGNEVSCGVGMQRIDAMIVQENGSDVYIKVIELKYIAPYMDILNRQLPWYIKWVEHYIAPIYTSSGKNVHIIPCIIAATSTDSRFLDACREFHKSFKSNKNLTIERGEYIGFEFDADHICFNKIL